MKSSEKLWQIILFAICIVYILLRLQHLTDLCLWFDEIFSIHAAEHDWQNLFRFVVQDLIHPPLFYVLLKIWILTVGESLFQLRFFPVLFSIISLIPFYLLCRQLKLNYLAIALAFSFFAANGSLIKYAQEVRMYSVLLCLSLFSLWLFLRFLNLAKDTVLSGDRVLILQTIDKIDSVLGIFGEEKQEILDAEIESLIEERQEARRNRNFARSDEIRDLLAGKGIALEDTKDGVRWKRK